MQWLATLEIIEEISSALQLATFLYIDDLLLLNNARKEDFRDCFSSSLKLKIIQAFDGLLHSVIFTWNKADLPVLSQKSQQSCILHSMIFTWKLIFLF
jgi:hypothetical protein